MPPPATELAERLGVTFRDQRLLEQALVHSSYVNEHPDVGLVANERLEFLGDAVLSLVISEALWRMHPAEPEGLLTPRRAAIVSSTGLARIGTRIDLGTYLVVGAGAERAGERRRGSVIASTLEALVAAVYLDQGLDVVRDLVLRLAAPELESAAPPLAFKSPKSQLQERCYAQGGRPPSYKVVSVSGPDHARHYVVEVAIAGRVLGRGEGANRREAETEAAGHALIALDDPAAVAAPPATVDAPLPATAPPRAPEPSA
ncbi:MAG: ribonuclease III [Chloroflexota bacterium]